MILRAHQLVQEVSLNFSDLNILFRDINKITTTRLLLFSQHQTTVIDALTWELIWKLMKKWAINCKILLPILLRLISI